MNKEAKVVDPEQSNEYVDMMDAECNQFLSTMLFIWIVGIVIYLCQ